MRVFLWIVYLVAILGPTWPGTAHAQQIDAADQPKLNGALEIIEQFAVRRVIEAISVDAAQWSSFKRELDTEGEVWSVTGQAVIIDAAGYREQHPYSARLEVLCDSYEQPGCWNLKTLTLGLQTFSGTSPSVVSLAELKDGSAPEAAAAGGKNEVAQPASEPAAAAPSKEEALLTLTAAGNTGNGKGQDIGWLRALADKGEPDAQYQLAERYRIGYPVEQDTAKAVELYELSAGQGFAASQFRLGELYEEGEILDRDLGKAVESYRKAAEQGHPGAQYALAHIYHLGSGVPQDMAAAMVWYRKAALQGDEWSQLALGDQYRIGLAVQRDLVQSTKWYRMAAEQGNIFAQYELGNAYRYGNGVDKDLTQAIEWYRASSAAGNPSANLALTELEAGDGAVASATTQAPGPETSQQPGSEATAQSSEDGLTLSDVVTKADQSGQAAERAAELDTAEQSATAAPQGDGPDLGTELAFVAAPSLSDEETVSQLLTLAKSQVAKLALTTPAGDNAYETYQLILSIQPNNAGALAGIREIGAKYAALAETARARGRTDQASVYAGKALELAPDHPAVQAMLAELQGPGPAAEETAPSATSVVVALNPPEPPAGEPAGSDIIDVATLSALPGTGGGSETAVLPGGSQAPKPELLTSGLLYAVSGLDAHQVGNYREAIEFYTLAIKAGDLPDRSLAYVYNNRGASYRNLSLYNQAIEDYDAAIRLNPRYATAFYNRGIAYDRKGFHELAIDDFDTAIRLNPDLSDAYNQRGLAYVKDGRYDIAIENFSQAIRLDPELDSAYFNRGLAYQSQGDLSRAAEDIKKSHDMDPDNPEYGKKLKELGIL